MRRIRRTPSSISASSTCQLRTASCQKPAVILGRAGHLDVQPALDRFVGGVVGAPIRDHHPFISPFALEDLAQQVPVLAGIHTVDAVVRAHHRPGLSLLDDRFKGRQVDLAQGALVHHRAAPVTLELLVVGREMLERGADLLALDAPDVPHADPALPGKDPPSKSRNCARRAESERC